MGTSVIFAAKSQILRQAKQKHEQEALARWFASKYKLPAHHPLYLSRSEAEHMVDQYSDVYAQREETLAMLEEVQKTRSPDVEGQRAQNAQKRVLIERLNVLNGVLEEPLYDDDPLMTQWDKDLAEGRTPDFNKRA